MNEFANILQTVMGKRTVQFWLVGLLFSLAIISVVAGPTVLQAETGFTLDLTSLEVTDSMGTTIDLGTFDPAVRTYSANVASTVERVTVTARPESDSGVKVNLAPGDYRPDDNLWEVEGREVSINHGRNLILIGVYSYWVDEPLRVYTVEINRAGSATSGAENHISSSSLSTAREGSTVPFLLTRSGDVSAALTVPVDIWSSDDTGFIYIVPHIDPVTTLKRVEVEFPAGGASAIVNHETTDDSLYTGGYHLGVTLIEGTGYRVPPFYGSGRFASTLVWDNDINKPNLELLSLTDQNGGGVAIGDFDPDLTSYLGSVGSEVTHVTVTQSTTERSRFASRVLPPDSQPNVAGHQVALQHGANLVSVILMAPFHDDAVISGTYDVIVTRAGSPSGTPTPTVSVYGLSDAKEGYTMPFILARTGDTSQSLTVPVNVSETGGDLVPQASEGSSDVVFPAGSASARIEVPTVADQDWEEHSTVTVAVVDGTGYELSSQSGAASSTVKDNDVPAVTAAFTVDSGQPQEGDVVTASVTVTTDGPKQPHGYVGNLDFSAEPGSAQQEDLHIPFDSNYRNFPEGHRVTGSRSYGGDGKSASFPVNQQAMQPVESDGVITHYQYQFSVPILIVDDERAEADETFDISVEWDSYSRGRTLIMDQGITSRTVTIQEHDDTPASPSPISYITVVIADSGTAGSTYTVSWHDTKECVGSRKYEVYLTSLRSSGWTSLSKLGETASTNTQLTVSTDNFPLSGQRNLRVYCGDMGRTVGEVPLPSATVNSVERPVPGTYSSQPALTSLTVSLGTLGPAFSNYGFLYSVLDVPDSSSQITLNATARSGYTISWDPSEDADDNTDGHQVDLAEGYDSIFVSVDHDLGINSFIYEVIVKGAGPIALQQQENSPATGTPTISGTVQMGETLTASTSGISDDNGLTNPSYTHQWLSNDGTSDSEIADATASTYTLVASDVAETIKVRVSFTDDAGYEETSTSEATAAVAPADTDRPYGLAASATMASVTLTWQEPDNFYGPDYHILRYRPEEGEPDPLVYVEFTDTDATTFTDTDVEPGVLYVYQVRATIDFFSTLGEPSNPIEVRVPEKSGSDAPGESNTSATGTPTISGTAQVGETLAADTSGIADSDGLTKVTYSYQWIRNDAGTDTDIQGAAGTTYTLVGADEGKTIKVTVSFADDSGNEETLFSAATASVAARPNSPATGAPTISGTVQVGETLTASTSGIADSNGLTNASYSFQWIANDGTSDSDIAGATASTYAVPVGNVGKTIKVKVTFTDDAGNEESLTSSETAEVTATWKATLTVGSGENSGTAFKGYSVFADGLGGLTPRQFLIGEEQYSVSLLLYSQTTLSLGMSGNIGTGFVLHLGTETFDLGDSSTRQGDTAYIYSWSDVDLDWSEADTVVVALVEVETEEASGNSPPTGAPSISGTVEVGDTLTASTSGIADTDGLTNASYSYQWVRNDGSSDTDIQDATGTSYSLVDADEGKTIKVKVSFTDDAGNDEALTSAATAAVAARPNSPATGTPTISGTAQVGEMVTASTSGIADPDGLTNAAYSYQWTANDGSSDTDIQDATGSTYTLVDADEGKTIKVKVSFTDDAGHEETLTSAATALVATRPNSPATGAPTIGGTVQVGETLTTSTSGIADTDGLTDVTYSYQWIRNDGTNDSDIAGATSSTYTLVDADEGKTIKVKMSFTDDASHEETLTSAATSEIATAPSPLTVSLENSPASHNGTDVFTFQVRFSEELKLSYRTLRDHAFTVDGGTVKKAQRQVRGSNIGWTITVEPDFNADVRIVLPTTTDCAATGAICTEDGRKLDNSLDFTISGPI